VQFSSLRARGGIFRRQTRGSTTGEMSSRSSAHYFISEKEFHVCFTLSITSVKSSGDFWMSYGAGASEAAGTKAAVLL
jgi:hypothetical protein